MSPRPDRRAERIPQILEAARAVFARSGFAQSRMDEIAREAGLSKAAIYLYFPGKDELISALLQQYFAGGESGPPPYTVLGGMQAMNPNRIGWTTVDLTPGEYIAICVVPDPSSGKPHVELGMIHGFTVR